MRAQHSGIGSALPAMKKASRFASINPMRLRHGELSPFLIQRPVLAGSKPEAPGEVVVKRASVLITELDAEVAQLQGKATLVAEYLRKLVEENARVRRDQKEYQREYDRLVVEYDRINAQIQAIEDRNRDRGKRRRKLEVFLGILENMEVCEAFEPYTFATMVEKVVVGRDGRLEFFFRSGMIVEYLLKS